MVTVPSAMLCRCKRPNTVALVNSSSGFRPGWRASKSEEQRVWERATDRRVFTPGVNINVRPAIKSDTSFSWPDQPGGICGDASLPVFTLLIFAVEGDDQSVVDVGAVESLSRKTQCSSGTTLSRCRQSCGIPSTIEVHRCDHEDTTLSASCESAMVRRLKAVAVFPEPVVQRHHMAAVVWVMAAVYSISHHIRSAFANDVLITTQHLGHPSAESAMVPETD